jgi:hypothetical protein
MASPPLWDRIKLAVFHGLQRWGFWAIVAAASVCVRAGVIHHSFATQLNV